MFRLATPTDEPPLPLLITGIAGVPGYNALGYFRAKYPGQVVGIRQADNVRLDGPGVVACNAEDRDGLRAAVRPVRLRLGARIAPATCALKPCELAPEMAWRDQRRGRAKHALADRAARRAAGPLSCDLVFSGETAAAATSKPIRPTR